MPRKIITKSMCATMLLEYKNGTTIDELSEKYGFKSDTIRNHFRANGLVFSKAKRFTDEELNNIIQDYLSGCSPKELGEKYHRHSCSIIGKLQSIGVYKKATHRFTNEEIEMLKIHYPLGNWDIIFKNIPDTTKQSVQTIMSRLGVRAEKFHEQYNWTDEELQILKENYSHGNIEKLCELLPNRSYKAITTKAKRCKLKTREYWTKEEQEYLKENYHTQSMDEIVKHFSYRSRNSIIAQAAQLNLTSSSKYNAYEVQFIIDNWRQMTDKEMAILLHKSHRGLAVKRVSLGLYREKEQSSYEDLSTYVRKNNLEWKKMSIQNCNYKCIITGQRFDDIYHIHGLNLILDETLEELNMDIKPTMDDYSQEELTAILKTFRIIQNKYPLGACLTKEIHMAFHNKYGYGNNTQVQWDSFIASI